MRSIPRMVTASSLVTSFIIGAACSERDSTSPADAQATLRVSVSPKIDTIVIGSTTRLTVRIFEEQNVTREHAVDWRSDNGPVASVSRTGLVAAVSAGVAHIIADAGGTADTATIVVQLARPFTISPGATLIMLGDSLRLSVSSSMHDNVTTSAGVQWVTSDPSVVGIAPDGLLTTVDTGTATISAEMNGTTASAVVEVLRSPTASVTISPLSGSIYAGETLRFDATALDADGRALRKGTLKWTSSDPALATVSDDGVVSGVKKGTAIIAVQSQGKKATATLTVLDVPAASVAVALAINSLSVGQTTQALATIKDAQGNVLNGRFIAWQSSNPALVAVTASGLVTAIANGSVTISATCDGKVGSASLSVQAPTPASISIVPASVSVTRGQTAQLSAEVRDANGSVIPNQTLTWSSANNAVASVAAAGMVSGVAVGVTSVQVASAGLTTSAQITVTAVTATSVVVSPSRVTLTTGDTTRFSATVHDAGGAVLTDRVISWSSSNPGAATIGSTGLVTAVAAGNTTVTALVDGISSVAAVSVTAQAPASVATASVTLNSTSLSVGQTTQATAVLRDAAGNILTGRTVTWSTANAGVATVSTVGLVTAVSPGSASILASSEGQTGASTVTVPVPVPLPVATVKVALSAVSLGVGQAAQATATLLDSAGRVLTGRTVGWTSSDAAVAAVSPGGVVTALAAGTASVVAASEGKSAAAALTVTAPVTSPPPSGGASCGVTDLTRRPTSAFAKPGYLAAATEPDFGTTLVRITGDPGTPLGNGVSGTWPSVARQEYSKVQPWSADMKYLFIRGQFGDGGPSTLFLDGATYKPLLRRAFPGTETRWHPTVPDLMIYVTASGSVGRWNPMTNAATVEYSTTAYSGALMGDYEGNPSGDGRYVAVLATRTGDGKRVVYVVDREAGTKSADLDLVAQGVSSLDWASVSQGGRYLVLHGVIEGLSQRSKVYDRATLALVGHWTDHPLGHFDLGVDAAGNEVAFGAASGGTYARRFVMRRLDNAQVTPLTAPVSDNWHASTRATRRPGWGLVVTNDATGSAFDQEIYWVRLSSATGVQRLAHHRTNRTDGSAAAVPVPSPDGRRVMFGSNWDASTGRPMQTFVIDTRLCP